MTRLAMAAARRSPEKQGTRELLREFPNYCLSNAFNLLIYCVRDADAVLDAAAVLESPWA